LEKELVLPKEIVPVILRQSDLKGEGIEYLGKYRVSE